MQEMQIQKGPADKRGSDSLIERNRSVRILAKSIYRELKAKGYDDRQIVTLATELLSEVTDEMSRESAHREQDHPRHSRTALRRA